MGVSGIPQEKWDGAIEKTGGYPLTPIGAGLDFEVVKVKEGVDKNRNEFLSVGCIHYNDEGEKFYQNEYFVLDNNPDLPRNLGLLKAFLKRLGRADLMHEDADWDELKDTQFRADCSHSKSKKDGKTYANLDYQTIIAVSHDCFERPAAEEEPTEDEGETRTVERQSTKKQPAPRRAPRARSQARG